MSGARLRERLMPNIDMGTTNDSTDRSTIRSRTVTSQETYEWQLEDGIIRGYRRAIPNCWKAIISLTFVHNETCNVVTHLIGTLLLPFAAAGLLRNLAEPRFLDVTLLDYAIFGMFCLTAEICLVLSTIYHLMLSHSQYVKQFWHGMDLLGIVIVTVGTLSSGIYYVFFCEPSLQRFHWAIILTTGTNTGFFISTPSLRMPQRRKAKVGALVVFGASSFIPLLHGVQRYGLNHMLQYTGMRWYLLELALYGTGVILYVFRIPECLLPGKFDIWGSSHQIFHLAILCAMYTHVAALREGFIICHTLDVCQL